MGFGFESTTDDVIDGIDLTGKRAIVTGASGGLGEETARALASAGAAVTLTARDIPKGEAVATKIRESTGNPNVDVRALELADLASVRAFAEGFLAVFLCVKQRKPRPSWRGFSNVRFWPKADTPRNLTYPL